jgi:hypothetical protein
MIRAWHVPCSSHIGITDTFTVPAIARTATPARPIVGQVARINHTGSRPEGQGSILEKHVPLIHGSGPVEREFSKPGAWVSGRKKPMT